jgi:hypothetical protein
MAISYLTYKAGAYTSNTLPISSITTTGFVNGQTVIVAFAFAFGTSQPTITKPNATWTQIGADVDTGTYCRAACYYHIWATGETAYTWATSNATYGNVCLMAFNGVDYNTPIGTYNTGKANSGTTLTVNAINANATGTSICGFGGNYRSSAAGRTFSSESCATAGALSEKGEGASISYVNVMGSNLIWSGSGTTGNFTTTISGTNSGWVGFLVTLNDFTNINKFDTPTVTDVISSPLIPTLHISVYDSAIVTDVIPTWFDGEDATVTEYVEDRKSVV